MHTFIEYAREQQ